MRQALAQNRPRASRRLRTRNAHASPNGGGPPDSQGSLSKKLIGGKSTGGRRRRKTQTPRRSFPKADPTETAKPPTRVGQRKLTTPGSQPISRAPEAPKDAKALDSASASAGRPKNPETARQGERQHDDERTQCPECAKARLRRLPLPRRRSRVGEGRGEGSPLYPSSIAQEPSAHAIRRSSRPTLASAPSP